MKHIKVFGLAGYFIDPPNDEEDAVLVLLLFNLLPEPADTSLAPEGFYGVPFNFVLSILSHTP